MNNIKVIQHHDREGPGLFAEISDELGLKMESYRPDQGEALPTLVEGDSLLVMGGPMGLSDLNKKSCQWMRDELKLIKNALDVEIPIIGVCLGAQFLGYAGGGNVEQLRNKSTKKPLAEVGWKPIKFQKGITEELILKDIPNIMDVLHWHGDRIVLPDQARLLASSAQCDEQMFRIGRSAYGLQFHIELEEQDINKWIVEDSEFIKNARGNDAEELIMNENKIFSEKSLKTRLDLIRNLLLLLRGE